MAGLLAPARDPWWIITGAAVALHGGDTPVRDVDVLASERDARMLLGPGAAQEVPHPRYRSVLFGRLHGWPLPAEVMAGFQLCTAGVWEPVRFVTREMIAVGDATLPVPAKHELAGLLARLGRPKDRARRAMLGC